MSQIDILLEGVGKQYRLGTQRSAETFWALKNVNLAVPRGAAFGVIGRNGAGKSTLLKLLAGITAPTTGRITIAGRLSALIEVGSGFHPELTGRENVFLCGAMLGMRRREIAAKIDRIFEFAGVLPFAETPVKRYSSGMYVRLGFAIAAHLEPHVLLVDEVLAVGDAEFQVKCLERIRDLRRQGVTILFISHDLTAVEQLCDRAALIDRGEVVAVGDPVDVVGAYHRRLTTAQRASVAAPMADPPVRLTNLTFEAARDGQLARQPTDPLHVRLRYDAIQVLGPVHVDINFFASDGITSVATVGVGRAGSPVTLAPPGGVLEVSCPALPLPGGAYYVTAIIRDVQTQAALEWWDGGTVLHVAAPASAGSPLPSIPHSWRVRLEPEVAAPVLSVRGDN